MLWTLPPGCYREVTCLNSDRYILYRFHCNTCTVHVHVTNILNPQLTGAPVGPVSPTSPVDPASPYNNNGRPIIRGGDKRRGEGIRGGERG